ncbi:MAG: potassium transporter TrkG, partial [Pseudomonadota bacterium]
MGLLRILLWLGYALLASATFMAIAACVGLMMLELRDAGMMLSLAILSGLVGALMLTSSFRTASRESASGAILFLILFWSVVPLICALPFYVLGGTTSIWTALFEGISTMTTTGASTLNPENLSDTLLFWRSLLQFFGGVSAATFAVVILAALNLTGTGIHRSGLFTFRTGELFPKMIRIGRLVGAIYLFLALVAFVLMVMAGTDAFVALCLALSGISTGGLQPFIGPVSNVLNPFSAVILALLCLFGAFNVSILWDFLRIRRFRQFLKLMVHVEHRGLLGIAAALIILTVIFADLSSLGSAILDSVFFASSAGYRYDVISVDMIPAPVLIAVALIGGSALSTAGGIK